MDLESKRRKWDRAVKVAVAIVVGCVVGPFAIAAIGGIAALVIVWLMSEVVICFTPWMSMKFANWRVASIKHEAAKNPIETMENEYSARIEQLGRMREAIRTFHASIRTFHGKLQGFREQFPQDSKLYDDQYNAMCQLLELRKEKYREAKHNLEVFASVIQRAKAIWAMAQEAAKMRNAAGADVEEFYGRLKVETALDSVTNALNLSFADLEDALLDEKDGKSVVGAIVSKQAAASVPAQLPQKVESIADLEIDFAPEPVKVEAKTKKV